MTKLHIFSDIITPCCILLTEFLYKSMFLHKKVSSFVYNCVSLHKITVFGYIE